MRIIYFAIFVILLGVGAIAFANHRYTLGAAAVTSAVLINIHWARRCPHRDS